MALKRENYHVDYAADGLKGEELAMINSYGVILLDLMLPGKDGQTICRNLRASGVSTPVLMVTAKDQVRDRVEGLDLGADDYLVKPFALEELLARVRALTRRETSQRSSKLEVGPISIDSLAQVVTVNGEEVHLTQREYSLLEALARNLGRVLTRDAILQRIWNNDEALPNTVNFHMKSLRRKVDPDGKIIHTVHGFGYVMRLDS